MSLCSQLKRREWTPIARLPQTRHHHGCGTFQDQNNKTVLVVFGGLSGKTEYLNDILILLMDSSNSGWTRFESTSVPYSNIILKSMVLHLDEKRCDIVFAGIDGLYVCKKNFQWTSKAASFSDRDKFTWSGISRMRACWNEVTAGAVQNY